MTQADLEELKQLLAAYRAARHAPAMAAKRRRFETALIRHADALIAAAESCLAFAPTDDGEVGFHERWQAPKK